MLPLAESGRGRSRRNDGVPTAASNLSLTAILRNLGAVVREGLKGLR
ncbi:MAG: hypothetical protein ACLFM4_04745 [Phormidium sp.]